MEFLGEEDWQMATLAFLLIQPRWSVCVIKRPLNDHFLDYGPPCLKTIFKARACQPRFQGSEEGRPWERGWEPLLC